MVPVIMPASPPVMNSRGLTPVLCSITSAARSAMPASANTAPRDTAPMVLLASTPAMDGVLCSTARAMSLVLLMSASRIMWMPGTISPPQMLAAGIDAVDLDGGADIDHAQRRAGLGPGADDGEPAVGPEQRRIQIAVGELVEIAGRR